MKDIVETLTCSHDFKCNHCGCTVSKPAHFNVTTNKWVAASDETCDCGHALRGGHTVVGMTKSDGEKARNL